MTEDGIFDNRQIKTRKMIVIIDGEEYTVDDLNMKWDNIEETKDTVEMDMVCTITGLKDKQ